MLIINHGAWERYTPDQVPAGIPDGVAFCRRVSDGKDWYELCHDRTSFSDLSVKLTVLDDIVRAASFDAQRLFPQNCSLLEVTGYDGADPQSDFGGKCFNAGNNAFEAPPTVVPDVPASSAKLVLDDDGIYDDVEALCLAHPVKAVRIYWTTATMWQWSNPYVQAIGAEMQLSTEQMLDMFRRADLKQR